MNWLCKWFTLSDGNLTFDKNYCNLNFILTYLIPGVNINNTGWLYIVRIRSPLS